MTVLKSGNSHRDKDSFSDSEYLEIQTYIFSISLKGKKAMQDNYKKKYYKTDNEQ